VRVLLVLFFSRDITTLKDVVLSPNLKKLYQRCFSEGLREPLKRPGISQWVEALYSAADFTVQCLDCASTYYANQKSCPWCDHPRPTQVQLLIKRWEPLPNADKYQEFLSDQKILAALALTENRSLILTDRIINGRTGSHTPAIELQLQNTNIRVRSLNGQCFWLSFFEEKRQTIVEVQDEWKRFQANDPHRHWLLHFANPNRSHRIATFRFISGEIPS
jgi:eukaryotic-like serine/threonine-protein kinase